MDSEGSQRRVWTVSSKYNMFQMARSAVKEDDIESTNEGLHKDGSSEFGQQSLSTNF